MRCDWTIKLLRIKIRFRITARLKSKFLRNSFWLKNFMPFHFLLTLKYSFDSNYLVLVWFDIWYGVSENFQYWGCILFCGRSSQLTHLSPKDVIPLKGSNSEHQGLDLSYFEWLGSNTNNRVEESEFREVTSTPTIVRLCPYKYQVLNQSIIALSVCWVNTWCWKKRGGQNWSINKIWII